MREFVITLSRAINRVDGFTVEILGDDFESVLHDEDVTGNERLLVAGNFLFPPPERYLEISVEEATCHIEFHQLPEEPPASCDTQAWIPSLRPLESQRSLFDTRSFDLSAPDSFDQLAKMLSEIGLRLPDDWWLPA